MKKGPGPNDPCWCGSGQKYKKCHRGAGPEAGPVRAKAVHPGVVTPPRPVPPHIARPNYATTGRPRPVPRIPDPEDRVARIRRACRAAAEVLEEAGRAVRPGTTTDELDRVAHEATIARGGYPSPLNYRGFPKSICTSVNEIILHGIPDSRPLEPGDMVKIDVTVYLDGVHGDCCGTYFAGEPDGASVHLSRVTDEARRLGIDAVRPGLPVNVIGAAIEKHASRYGYGVVRAFCGHGIGEEFHTEPQVLHYFEPKATTPIEEGMVFTVEPMLTQGSWRHVEWRDGWTIATVDGLRAAQFEHTILVHRDGAEILTAVP
jgi:methionyl aminopeptidase